MTHPGLQYTTSNYRTYRPAMGVAIRTTVGAPRWFRQKHVHAKLASPYGIFGVYEREDEYREHYLYRLDRAGYDVIAELDDLTGGVGGCLLCFCVLEKTFCHRRMLAEWLETRHGLHVPEHDGQPRLWAVD